MNNKDLKLSWLCNSIFVLALGSVITFSSVADDGFAAQNGGTTGGEGGETVKVYTGTELNQAICARESRDTPLIIKVKGTITPSNTKEQEGNCTTDGSKIWLKDISNISIIGSNDQAIFDEIGIGIEAASNIIIRNVTVRNVKKQQPKECPNRQEISPTSNEGDAISLMKKVKNVWVDHVTLEASGGECDGFDALFDITNNVKYVTLSYSILRNSSRGGLIGTNNLEDPDDDNDNVTFHHNFYQNLKSRQPSVRYAISAHSYNNYFSGIRSTGINSRSCAKIRIENNLFEDSKNPIGGFYIEDKIGGWDVNGNTYDNVTWKLSDSKHPAGPDVQSTTYVNIPYTYALDNTNYVKNIVSNMAGANKGLNTSSGPNLSIGARSDGSSKASGTSYNKVHDDDMATYWSPIGSTGRISIKWDANTSVNTVSIKEAQGFGGRIGDWKLVNHDNGKTITKGNGAGVITFPAVSLQKIDFVIKSSKGTPAVAEFETYEAFDTSYLCTTGCYKSISANLSIGAGSDGSSKASGTSYGNVRDGDMSTYWSPVGSTGRISIKWESNTKVNTVNIREASGFEGRILTWKLVDHDNGKTLASGDCLGAISFPTVSLRKVDFVIESAKGTPGIAEFETYKVSN